LAITQLVILILLSVLVGPAVFVSYCIVLVMHELAHWGVAKLVDPKGTYTIQLGSGRRVASFSMFGTRVNLHAMPVMGYVYGSSSRPWSLWQQVFWSAAGFLVNGVLAVVSFLLVHWSATGSAQDFSLFHMIAPWVAFMAGTWDYYEALPRADRSVYIFGLMNAFAMWHTMIPVNSASYTSDGWSIVQLVRAHLVYKKEQARSKMGD